MGKFLLGLLVLIIAGCSTDAEVASYNVSKDADQFLVTRRIIFYDSIQGAYLLSIEGRCSIKVDRYESQLEVICKTSPVTYKKHFLGISDNVTYFAEQLVDNNASTYRYKVIFKPTVIFPDVDFKS